MHCISIRKMFVLVLSGILLHQLPAMAQNSQSAGDLNRQPSTGDERNHREILSSIIGTDTISVFAITTTADYTFVCRITGLNDNELIALTEDYGALTIPLSSVESIEKVPEDLLNDGEYWFPAPNPTRYFFGASAFTLKQNEGYYHNTMILFNSVFVGVTDNISVGTGLEAVSTILGDPTWTVATKVGFEVDEKWHIGGGIGYGRIYDGDEGWAIFGLGTYGTKNDNITIGAGLGLFDGEYSGAPAFSLSGVTRTFKHFSFVTENYIVIGSGEAESLFSYGVRYSTESFAFDLALVNNPEIIQSSFIGVPYIDFMVSIDNFLESIW